MGHENIQGNYNLIDKNVILTSSAISRHFLNNAKCWL